MAKSIVSGRSAEAWLAANRFLPAVRALVRLLAKEGPPEELAEVLRREATLEPARDVRLARLAQLADVLPVLQMRLSEDERRACDGINPPGSACVDFHNTADWMRATIDG